MNLRNIFVTSMTSGLCALTPVRDARAGEPTTKECLTSSETSIKLANEYKLRAERTQLLICASASCPADVRKECLRRVDDVNMAIPSIVFEVKNAAGNDLTAVKVTMDGELLTERLRGVALIIDPGEHTFRFETSGEAPVEKQLLIRESQKDRHESIQFGVPKRPESISTRLSGSQARDPEGNEAQPPTAKGNSELPQSDFKTEPAASPILNLVSLGVQQDYLHHSESTNGCAPNSRFECFQGNGERVLVEDSSTIHTQVLGSGFTAGTLRLLAGYDRFIVPRLSVGLRLGAVISGKPKQSPGDAAFLFLHGEARAAFWFVRKPLTSSFSPYVFAAVGAAETDIKVQLRYQDPAPNCSDCRLDGWKRAGFEFVGGGVGVVAVIAGNSGPLIEARYSQFLGKTGSSLSGQLGYAIGF